MSASIRSNVRELRLGAGWSQAHLGERVGISRQALAAIESGRSIPSTEVALRLARAFRVPLEKVFSLADDDPADEVAEWSGIGAPPPGRVRLATIAGRRLAYGVRLDDPRGGRLVDGLATPLPDGRLRVSPLPGRPPAPELLVAGCDPAFGIVKEWLRRERGIEVLWLSAGSRGALDALARGVVHVAGVHLRDAESGMYNGPWVRRLVPFRSTRITFSRWEQALLLPAGNPMGVSGIEDLARPGIRFVNREPGSGSRALAEARLAASGMAASEVPGFEDTVADSHEAVGTAIASGTANAGVAIRSVALARGLSAIPLVQEPYELVIPDHFLGLPAVEALLEALRRPELERQVEALGGYDAVGMGLPA